MKKLFLYIGIILLTSCTINEGEKVTISEENKPSEIEKPINKVSYSVGRVQTLKTSCIGSIKPIINQNPILIGFYLDEKSGIIKNIEFKQVKINSNPEINCVNELKRSTVETDYSNFYGLDNPIKLGIVNYFILGDDQLILRNKDKKILSFDLNQDGKPDFFDMYYSSEGLHFNIWESSRKKAKIFHDAVYLDFETVDDCKKEDY